MNWRIQRKYQKLENCLRRSYVNDPLKEFQFLAMSAIIWVGTVFGNGQDILGKSGNPCVWVRGDGILNIANGCSAAQIEPMRLLSPARLLSDKIPHTVRLGNILFRVPHACFGHRVGGSMAGTPVELSEKSLQNLLVL